jgi:hypothetical protein
VPAQREPIPEEARVQSPPLESEHFVAHPILEHASLNDDLSNLAPSPPVERVKESAKEVQSFNSGSPAKRSESRKDRSGSCDSELESENSSLQAKREKKKVPVKKFVPPPTKPKRPRQTQKQNSADRFDFDPNDIKFDFDFDGVDPFA